MEGVIESDSAKEPQVELSTQGRACGCKPLSVSNSSTGSMVRESGFSTCDYPCSFGYSEPKFQSSSPLSKRDIYTPDKFSTSVLPVKHYNLTPRYDATTYYPKLIIRADYEDDKTLNKGWVPMYVEYNLYEKRLETFKIWHRQEYQKGKDMAEAGFFFSGSLDRCVCKHCGLVLKNWEQFDMPMRDHKYWSPHCKFVQQNYNFRIHQ